MSSSSSTIVHTETYREWTIQIVHVLRTGSVLGEEEFQAFIGNELTWDECTSCMDALIRARKTVDQFIKLQEKL